MVRVGCFCSLDGRPANAYLLLPICDEEGAVKDKEERSAGK